MTKENFTRYILIIFNLLLISFLVGYFLGLLYPSLYEENIKSITGSLDFISNLPDYLVFVFIFINNTFKAFITVIFGVFFGLFPIYFIASNGFLIGLITASVSKEVNANVVIAGLLPHGIFEITAIVMSGGLGLWLGVEFFKKIKTGKSENLNSAFKKSMTIFLKVILPLFLIAALIETYITPVVMNYFIK